MKTILLSVLMLGAALTADAQATVKAGFNKNDTTIYKNVINMNINLPMGQGNKKITLTSNTRYVVLDKTAKGYTVECNTTDTNIDGDKEIANQMQVAGNQFLTGVKMIMQLDADGKVEKILNLDEVAAQGSKVAIAEIEEQYKKAPMLEQVLPKGKALMAISEQFEEKALIDNINENSFFYYYGRALKNNGKEPRTKQNMKLTVTYTVENNGANTVITANSKEDMTENDVKNMMISQMKKMGMGEEVTSQIDANWGQMKAMGMANITSNGADTLKFLPNGWLESLSGKTTTKMMGMDMKFDTQTEITYKNWK